jgi:hypothetical protein
VNALDRARRAAGAFQLPGEIVRAEAYGDGLIHDTYLVSVSAGMRLERFILQHINGRVFEHPSALMENVERVAAHLERRALESGRDPRRNAVDFVRTRTGETWHEMDGQAWRMVRFIEGTKTVARDPSPRQAREIAGAFGRFLDDLSDFPAAALREVLPGYRDTERYLESLWRAVDCDALNRAQDAREEIAFLAAHADAALCTYVLLRSGRVPIRIVHGDTKLSNVLLDAVTEDGVCVIDLDTVMPGSLLHDMGDCVREAWVSASARTDRLRDGGLGAPDLEVFDAILSGFLAGMSEPPTVVEMNHVVASVQSITLELAARFLCDFLSGDRYFKTQTRQDNHERARLHLRLLQRIERSEGSLQWIVRRHWRRLGI